MLMLERTWTPLGHTPTERRTKPFYLLGLTSLLRLVPIYRILPATFVLAPPGQSKPF
jgi:hypothetical protein